MSVKEKKVHAGFRLTKKNIDLIKELENSLGINKTSVVDMILTMVGKDKEHFAKLIRKAIN
jgi:hypothetical protein